MNDANRRRHYWINPGFQGRYILTILGLELIAVLASALLSLGLAILLLNPAFKAGPGWGQILGGYVVLAVLIAAGLVWLGVRLSHRICGPAYRMCQDLRAVRQTGRTAPIHLRQGDELRELADEINRTLVHFQSTGAAPSSAGSASLDSSDRT